MAVSKSKTQETKAESAHEKSKVSTSKPRTIKPSGSSVGPTPSTTSEVLKFLRVITDPTRLEIIQALSEGEKTVKELCPLAGGSQPAINHHLALLRHSGVVTR